VPCRRVSARAVDGQATEAALAAVAAAFGLPRLRRKSLGRRGREPHQDLEVEEPTRRVQPTCWPKRGQL
jgi:hypothetical protein